MHRLNFVDEAALLQFAADFARALTVGDCVALEGELGAGKTTFSRSVIRTLAGNDDVDVPSPTFTLVQQYETSLPVSHMDLYRLESPDELDELGLEPALERGAVLIEWPDKAGNHLPEDRVLVHIQDTQEFSNSRIMEINGPPTFLKRLERSIEIRHFLSAEGRPDARRLEFSGDASARAYELIENDGEEASILMNAPQTCDGPPIYDGLPYSQVVHLAEDVSAFVAISELLVSNGFCAPKILAQDIEAGLLLIEHMGTGRIVDDDNKPIAERYRVAMELLADFHVMEWPKSWTTKSGHQHSIPRYDVRAMQIGISLLPDWWGKENDLGQDAIEQYFSIWAPHLERLQSGYDDLIIRDYHSPNIIWREFESGNDRIGIIDHQDALIGPGAYDVASLMQDARTNVSPDLQMELLDAYCLRRSGHGEFDEAKTRLDVATLGSLRNSRLLGLWARLDVRDGKSRFRQYETQTRNYLKQSLSHPGLNELRDWYVETGVIDGS